MPGANPLTMNRKELEAEVSALRLSLDQKISQLRIEREEMMELITELQEQIRKLKRGDRGDTTRN